MIRSHSEPGLFQFQKFTIFGAIALSLALFCGTALLYDNFWNSVLCTFYFPFADKETGGSKFLSCSNVEQVIDEDNSRNLADNAEPGTDWRVFAPSSPDAPAVLRITVKKDRDVVIFYPRLEGEESSIVVYADDGSHQRRLFALQGRKGAWTEMSRQYRLDLRSAPYGWFRRDVDVTLLIVLTGKWSQIWHLGSVVLF